MVGRNVGGVIGWDIGGYNIGCAMGGATGVSVEGDNSGGPGRATVGLPTMQNEVLSFGLQSGGKSETVLQYLHLELVEF